MKTNAWGVVKSVVDGRAYYAPTEFEIEDGQVVSARAFNAGIYEALAYAALPDIIIGFYRAHLTRKALNKPSESFPPEPVTKVERVKARAKS